MTRALVLAAALLAIPLSASAQAIPPPFSQGPMTVERLSSGWVAGPDFKVTDVDGSTGALVGGVVGYLSRETFLIGGAGYWLANGNNNRQLAYGGMLTQWQALGSGPLGFSANMLIGGGQATLTRLYTYYPPPVVIDPRSNTIPRAPVVSTVRYSDGVFVFEPEVGLLIKLSKDARITSHVGYRFVGSNGYDSDRLSGFTGSFGLQIGGGGS
ncbi:MAG TPA: hypothetical protein VGG73_11250 [Vicinamibacterales bacterium]|jgi:hypothetical protein